MNLNKFNSLPPDVRKVIDNNIDFYGDETEAAFNRNEEHATRNKDKLGVEFIPLSKEDLEKFYAPIKAMALSKAQELDARGLPGTKILNEAQRLIQMYNK
jgi:TRAP-type C4-dicarboxylate transport system substrate-binding protein